VALTFKSMKGLSLFDLMLKIAALIGIPIAVPMFFGIFIKKTPSWAGWSTMLVGLIFSIALKIIFIFFPPEIFFNFGFLHNVAFNNQEIADMEIAFTTGVLFFVTVCWYFFTMLFYRDTDKHYGKQVDDFFEEMHTPIDMEKEHVAEYEGDSRQTRVMGNLCLVYGSFIILLLFVPNTFTARIYIAFCGLFMAGFGVILHIHNIYLKRKALSNNSRLPNA